MQSLKYTKIIIRNKGNIFGGFRKQYLSNVVKTISIYEDELIKYFDKIEIQQSPYSCSTYIYLWDSKDKRGMTLRISDHQNADATCHYPIISMNGEFFLNKLDMHFLKHYKYYFS